MYSTQAWSLATKPLRSSLTPTATQRTACTLSPSALLPSTQSLYTNIDFQIPREDSCDFNSFEHPFAVDFFPSEMLLEEDLTTLQLPTAGFSKYVQVNGKAAGRTCTVL